MGRRIPIRAKVAAALAVPLVALVAGAGVGVATSTSQANTVTRQADLATASLGHAGLINVLQNERNSAFVEMLGLGDLIRLEVPDVADARQLTDAAHTTLHGQIADQDDVLREDWAAALGTLDDLPAVRQQVDLALTDPGYGNLEAAHDVFAAYTTMVSTIFASHDRFALVVDDAGLRQGDDLIHYSSHATDSVAQLMAQLVYVGWGPGGIDRPVEAASVAELARDVEKNNGVVKTKGTGPYADAAGTLLADPQVSGLLPFTEVAIARGGPIDTEGLLATTPIDADSAYLTFRQHVADVLEGIADDLHADANARRRWYAGGALAAVAIAVAVAWVLSRSITRPLRALSRGAREMADERLPSAVAAILDTPAGKDPPTPAPLPVTVTANDEVGDVAHALNEVQSSALGLATEQALLRRAIADSYVNLGRRNQNLLSRLLDVVGELERGEADPLRIGQLHRLDHLATRIRRNAESLLVLSDADVPTRWRPAVPIIDVVRASLGEIENYQRVVVRTLDPVMVVGGAASDLTHLLAELVENGVKHSPPHELVEIRGRVADDGYSLAVIDHGLGMSADEIARANRRLAGDEPPTVAVSKHLGHFVAAALAGRNGIKVRLQGSEVVGVAAIIDLPAQTLATSAVPGLRAFDPLTPDAAAPQLAGPAAPGPSADRPEPAVPAIAPVPVVAALPAADGAPDGAPAGVPTGAPNGAASTADGAAPGPIGVPLPPPPADRRVAGGDTAPPTVPPSPPPPAPRLPAAVSAEVVQAGEATPAVTASGLQRRIRGAQRPPTRGTLPAPESVDEVDIRRPNPDADEMQRFLTSLAAGVQKSLGGSGSEDESRES